MAHIARKSWRKKSFLVILPRLGKKWRGGARRTAAGGLDSPWAVGALVRLVATVKQLVADKIVLELEFLSTHVAFKVPFSLMGQLVSAKRRSLSEPLSTVITLVWLFSTRYKMIKDNQIINNTTCEYMSET